MKPKKKSPITGAPLRSAGQSIVEQQIKVLEGVVFWPMMTWAALVPITALEWMRFLRPAQPIPVLFSVLLAAATAFLAFRVIRARDTMKRLKMARDGERAVGEYLEKLRSQGYQVFHDLVGDGFNLDHVLIGPAGVFSIETKTYSKPEKGKAELSFDGERIKVGHWEPDRNPVIQARAQVGWLRALLKETTGREFPVHPVIVFPGWFVRSEGRPKRPIWVLNPKALPSYLANKEPVLTKEQIQMASYHLSRFIRVEEERRRLK
ncbi:nuclease-related domain-containing protein [Halomonas denitrificans]|nr:NERD domain-containing protein [Halomonas denitrificans]